MSWLKETEAAALRQPYPSWESAAHARRRLISQLFRPLPNVHALGEFLRSDLSQEDFGIPWMGGGDRKRRILVSDYAVAAAEAVEFSILDAVIARRRWQYLREHSAGPELARRFTDLPDGAVTPADEVSLVEAERELSALFVALGSALDQLMIALAAIVGMPVPLRTLGWSGGVNRAKQLGAQQPRSKVADALDQLVIPGIEDEFGPNGWLAWVLGTRNNHVHRPRRMAISPEPTTSCVPRDPDKTDVEVARDERGFPGMLLTEDAEETSAGALVSTAGMIEELSRRLIELALQRSRGVLIMEQPLDKQWSGEGQHSGFNGYAPDSVDVNRLLGRGAMRMSPILGARLKAAALLDHQRDEVWGNQ